MSSEITCLQCGTNFSCGSNGKDKCWCAAYPKIMQPDASKQCMCPSCLAREIGERLSSLMFTTPLQDMLEYAAAYADSTSTVEYIDYYKEQGYTVFTSWYHLKRGYCCGNGCRHCPYPKDRKE